MRCLRCGSNADRVACERCIPIIDGKFCYEVASFRFEVSENELLKEIASEMEKPYLLADYAIDLVNLCHLENSEYITLECLNLMQNGIGVPSRHRDLLLSLVEKIEENPDIKEEQKNLARALSLNTNIAVYNWDAASVLADAIYLDENKIDIFLILADYYIKIRSYDMVSDVLDKAEAIFMDEESQQRISTMMEDNEKRSSGEKKEYVPKEREAYFQFLDKHGIPYATPKKISQKIKEKDFKKLNYYDRDTIPEEYVAIWFVSEFHQVVSELVEINAVKVKNGEIVSEFSELVRPMENIKNAKNVCLEDALVARQVPEVFRDFMSFVGDDTIAIAGLEENSKLLCRAARYTMMDCIANSIWDVVAFVEDISDTFECYTRGSLLEKYGIVDAENGLGKARKTVELISCLG